ncbi:glycosyltransferase [Haloprofundus salilacus]|uniref:glycosyltransferase n=1 Tax=Haloprofundus salilacus TaxID=2876190 RepID=UPI001CCFDF79|nr:glycosyltransferase [Haloprofundus salilacus]
MIFVGYFPGIDFTDPDQFGRRIHTKKFIENFPGEDYAESQFIVGRGFNNDDRAVQSLGFGTSLPAKIARDIYGLFLLFTIWLRSDEPVVVYTRDSPYLSKLIVSVLPQVNTIIEVNGLPQTEADQNLVRRLYAAIRTHSRARAELLIAVSDSIKKTLDIERLNTPIHVVENGVDTNLFEPTGSEQTEDNTLRICYVGGLQEWQGIERMIDVVNRINADVKFTLVGGSTDRQQEVLTLLRQRGMDDEVSVVGRVDHATVPEYINDADVCFGPFCSSRYASPIKVYEYLSCGKPVIVLNDEGLESLDEYPGVVRLPSSTSDDEVASHVERIAAEAADNTDGRVLIMENHSWGAVTSTIHAHIMDKCAL